jgi:hypothetical protein
VYINVGLLNNIWGVGGYVITAQDFKTGCGVITAQGFFKRKIDYIKKDKNISKNI